MTTRRILHVDDDASVLRIVNKLLVASGFEVESIPGVSRKDLPEWAGYDLLILDWLMPEPGGAELCRLSRSGGYAGPILILSSKRPDEDDARQMAAARAAFLSKPFGPRELIGRVRECMAETQ